MRKILTGILFAFIFTISLYSQKETTTTNNQIKMEKTIKVAAAQVTPVFLNKQKTVEKACAIIEEAAQNGARLVVFPEAFIPGYPDWIWLIPNSKSTELNKLFTKLVENSVSIPDKSTDLLRKAAEKNKINVVMGINERNSELSNSSIYNSILFIDDKGEIIGKHRKLIPTGGERLIWARGDGSTLNSFQTTAGKVGGLICWENFMPLARNAMYELGTQILASPTWDKSSNWLISVQHIAREGGLFVISACMAIRKDDIPDIYSFKRLYPEDREWINTGNSCIVGPNGKILAGPLEAKEGILYADINLDDIIPAKRMFDAAGHYARPDVFRFDVIREQDK
jgi:nitrilase